VSRPRSGAFTDAETLELLERGATRRDLAELEHVTPNAIASRCRRARAMQADVLAGLRAAVERLERLEREIAARRER
jgi:phosphoserine phosphatase